MMVAAVTGSRLRAEPGGSVEARPHAGGLHGLGLLEGADRRDEVYESVPSRRPRSPRTCLTNGQPPRRRRHRGRVSRRVTVLVAATTCRPPGRPPGWLEGRVAVAGSLPHGSARAWRRRRRAGDRARREARGPGQRANSGALSQHRKGARRGGVGRAAARALPRGLTTGTDANPAMFSPSVDNLVAQLTRLPSVGQRTAQRLAFHILRVPEGRGAGALTAAITEVKERVRFCRECGNLTEEETCDICRDARRDHTTVCVVEQPAEPDLGRAHARVPRALPRARRRALAAGRVDPAHLRIDEAARPRRRTASRRSCSRRDPEHDRRGDRRLPGRPPARPGARYPAGERAPGGADLEYADEVTLGRALSGRREM